MPRRKLQELSLLDDFLFETIVGHPRWGEPFCRILLEIIFQRKLGNLRVVPQKAYGGKDIGLHGARLDVYVEEVPELPYDDGARTLFLYTKGTEGEPPEALRQLLHYMEDSTEKNAVNPELRELHRMVEAVKENREVERSYMKSWEREEEIRREEREKERLNTEREKRRAEQAEQKAEQAEQKAEQAEQKAEQAEQRVEQAEQKAEQERQRVEQERKKVEQERQRAEQAEAKIRELEMKIQKYKEKNGIDFSTELI